MKINLSQTQRIIVAMVYLFILAIIFNFVGGDFSQLVWGANFDSNIWFYAGAFMIILGAYIVEPYFTKPSDAIANSTAILIALFGLSNKDSFFAYNFIFYYSIVVLFLSIFTIFSKDTKRAFWHKLSGITYWLVGNFGNSKMIFSVIYLSAVYSYFATEALIIPFIIIIAFWICLTFFDLVGLIVEKISKLVNYLQNKVGEELGQAIGCDNPLLYKVEIDYSKHKPQNIKYGDIVAIETSLNIGSIGMVINSKYLLNKRWLAIYLLEDHNNEILKINLKNRKLITEEKSIFTKDNCTYLLNEDELDSDIREKINNNSLYQNKKQFIGYVTSGSNINTINFIILKDIEKVEHQISEGSILKTQIYDEEVLYQVINGNTKEEHLENFDSHGYTIGIARKLGKYKKIEKELDSSKWMPTIYFPLFFAFTGDIEEKRIKEIANNSIGRLPGTDLEIPIKDMNSIVTHNTAILGILGIGKSCLSYELIKKITDANIKVICIDITNEYKKELLTYFKEVSSIVFDDENAFNSISAKYEYIHTEGTPPNQKEYPEKSGNLNNYKDAINKNLHKFLFGNETMPESKVFNNNEKVRIYNIDYHKVSRGEKIGYKIITTDLTQAEKTKIIVEELFKILMKLPLTEEKTAKVLLVFEEAHSLIPEWSSVACDGDKNATNGTAKIILQGRKYGLGSLIITQRTANVSKSILNQCNTIFALRVFDDTGKGFLKNYIGEDYSDALSTLEERRAVAIGKGLRLKQPVIIELNNSKYIQIENKKTKK